VAEPGEGPSEGAASLTLGEKKKKLQKEEKTVGQVKKNRALSLAHNLN